MSVNRPQPKARDEVAFAPGLAGLVHTCHRGWAMAVLADLGTRNGTRVAELAHRLEAPRNSIGHAIDSLVELDLLARTQGHGHPLRPEVVLSPAGALAAPLAADVLDRMRSSQVSGLERRKWSLPALLTVGSGVSRFAEVRRALPPITDRALAGALLGLGEGRLVKRAVAATRPTRVQYTPTRRGLTVVEPLKMFAEALATSSLC